MIYAIFGEGFGPHLGSFSVTLASIFPTFEAKSDRTHLSTKHDATGGGPVLTGTPPTVSGTAMLITAGVHSSLLHLYLGGAGHRKADKPEGQTLQLCTHSTKTNYKPKIIRGVYI